MVKLNGRWYRLKGSGNNDEGFVVRTTKAKDGDWRDIRGCAFEHTGVLCSAVYWGFDSGCLFSQPFVRIT